MELIILGNGFDRNHDDFPSSYRHYRDFLNQRPDYRHLIKIMERYIPILLSKQTEQQFIWANFEEALGEMDFKFLMEELFSMYAVEYEEKTAADFSERELQVELSKFTKDLIRSFVQWIQFIEKKVDTLAAKDFPMIHNRNLFLTFNYTKLLKKIYGIHAQRICHIHGTIENPKSVVFDHRNREQVDKAIANSKTSRYLYSRQLEQMAQHFYRDTYKNCEKQIEKNLDFFRQINAAQIETVYVIGHSLSPLDGLYFEYLLSLLPSHSLWKIYIYYDHEAEKHQEKKRIRQYFSKRGVESKRISFIDYPN